MEQNWSPSIIPSDKGAGVNGEYHLKQQSHRGQRGPGGHHPRRGKTRGTARSSGLAFPTSSKSTARWCSTGEEYGMRLDIQRVRPSALNRPGQGGFLVSFGGTRRVLRPERADGGRLEDEAVHAAALGESRQHVALEVHDGLFTWTARQYADMFGPTTGDKNVWRTRSSSSKSNGTARANGDEVKFGGRQGHPGRHGPVPPAPADRRPGCAHP